MKKNPNLNSIPSIHSFNASEKSKTIQSLNQKNHQEILKFFKGNYVSLIFAATVQKLHTLDFYRIPISIWFQLLKLYFPSFK